MEMKVCGLYLARNSEKIILHQNLNLCAKFFDEVIILSPKDQLVDISGYKCVEVGESCHSGWLAIERLMAGIRYASSLDYDLFVFLEYDALLLDRPKFFEGFQTNIFKEGDVEKWGVDYYCHYPWIFSKVALVRLAETMTIEPMREGFSDRWIACQVEKLSIPTKNLFASHEGYSQNTIYSVHHESFKEYLEKGAYAIHGIKSDDEVQILKPYIK
jgi:hypothetical protein